MSVDQMLWHVNQVMVTSLGLETMIQDKAPLPRPVMKFIVLRLPWPKSAPTNPGFLATGQYDFEAERARCMTLIGQVVDRPIEGQWTEHPMFGKMSGREVSGLMAKHLNHHLGQFGV